MNKRQKEDLAAVLYYADRLKYRVAPITQFIDVYTEKDAYEIQKLVIEHHIANGDRIVGKKTGGISYGLNAFGGFGPHCGYILGSKVLKSDSEIYIDDMPGCGVEAEIAIRAGKDIETNLSHDEILSSIECIYPAWEIVESRVARKNKTVNDSIADNAAFGGLVIGEAVTRQALELDRIAVKIEKNGQGVDCATGYITEEDIVRAIQWLAGKLCEQNDKICKNDYILMGAMTKPLFFLQPGDTYKAVFSGIGEVIINSRS